MNLSEFFGLLTTLGMAVLILMVRSFSTSYSSKKGENLATKQDIAAITREVEAVKTEFAQHLERQKHSNQLRLAALDRRLEAHQQAFALWRQLPGAAHQEAKLGPLIMQCQEWWFNNCLYLEPNAREAFRRAYHAAAGHHDYKQDRSNPELVKRNWDDIVSAGEAIVKGAALPSLGTAEYELAEVHDKAR